MFRRRSPSASARAAVLFLVLLPMRAVGQESSPPSPDSGFVWRAPDGAVEGADPLRSEIAAARERVEVFFGRPFRQRFDVLVFPDRAALDAHWRTAWKLPDFRSECWMVASGSATELALLAPAAWASQACEHDASDRARRGALLAHELVHVFHAQHNPRPDMEGLDGIAWFVEGLAVHASGQLDDGHLASPREAIERGLAPVALADAWTGKYRYGVSGSLVRWIDRQIGRERLFALLAATSDAELLAPLGLGEPELLAAWRQAILAEPR